MNCNKAKELISLYIDNKLSSKEITELKSHLEQCKQCKQDYNSFKNIKKILANTSKKQVSKDFTSFVMNKIKNKEYLKEKDNVIAFGSLSSIKKKLIIAAGFLFVIVSSSFFFMKEDNNITVDKYSDSDTNYVSVIEEYYSYSEKDYSENFNNDYEEYMLSLFC